MDEAESVVINYNPRYVRSIRRMSLVMLAIMIAFVASGSALAIDRFLRHDWLMVGIGCFDVLMFATFSTAMWFEYRDFNRRRRQNLPAFVFTAAGIEDYASNLRVGPIAWDEIERIRIGVYNPRLRKRIGRVFPKLPPERVLMIKLKNRRTIGRAPWFTRFFGPPSRAAGGRAIVVISEAKLDTSANDALGRLNEFYLKHVQPNPGPEGAA